MTAITELLRAIDDLAYTSKVIEEDIRVTLEGEALDGTIRGKISRIFESARTLGLAEPSVFADSNHIYFEDLSDSDFDGETWRIVIGKSFAEMMRAREQENTLFFFSVNGFHGWLKSLDPFVYPSGYEPDFSKPLTIRVYGLSDGFGGPLLWVLPIDKAAPEDIKVSEIPATSDVQALIHVNAADKSLRVCPQGFALNWGDYNSTAAAPLMRMSALVLSACLVQELKRVDGAYEVMLRGTKRVLLPLTNQNELITPSVFATLIEAVSWIYKERPETRLKLVMDRLSIDCQDGDSLVSCIQSYLDLALQQAQDSYAFVILERKDAYYKEMRELMKDMKSQADLYAAKVRDLVAALTRDILGILALLGFSFIAKFDQNKILELLSSKELSLLVKFLAGYLVLTCAFQLIMHGRDANLAYKESQKWVDVLQNYTSRKDKTDNFLNLLGKRRTTLRIAMLITGVFYLLLAGFTWNIPCVIPVLLGR